MKYILSFITLLIATVLIMPATVSALSQEQINLFRSGVSYYDINATADTCNSGSVLVGSNFGEQIFTYLVSKGLSPVQAAGVMGNLQAESGLNPARVQNTKTPSGDSDTMVINGTTGYGLAQWTSKGRQQALHDAAAAAGKPDSDLQVQLDHLWSELSGGYSGSTLTPLLAAQDIRTATSIFMINFEAPADRSQSAQNARAALSIGLLTKYGSGATVGTNPTSDIVVNTCAGAGGSADQVNGSFALPVNKSFYEQHKEWFTKPHHDYPAADIPIPTGTQVYSMTDGKVIKAPAGGDCGIGVIVSAADGTQYIYCHGSDGGSVVGAKQGDNVTAGQLIMHSASTGSSTGPHLHLQIKVNDVNHCPQSLLVAIAEAQTLPSIATLPTSGCTN
ncbi:MAG: phage tail tip lysozyme [Candidatus Saccharimonadales bacterium]